MWNIKVDSRFNVSCNSQDGQVKESLDEQGNIHVKLAVNASQGCSSNLKMSKEIVALEAKNTSSMSVHPTPKTSMTEKKRVQPKITNSEEKSKKLKTSQQKKPVDDIDMTAVEEQEAAPDKSAAPEQKAEKAASKRKLEDSNQSGSDQKCKKHMKFQNTAYDYELLISCLSLSTSNDTVKEHFSQFGEVVNVGRLRRPNRPSSQGIAFVAFKEASSMEKAMVDTFQEIDSTEIIVEAKKVNKFTLFIGGLNFDATKFSVTKHFSQFGRVLKCTIPIDRRECLHQGTGLVYMDSQEAFNKALAAEHTFGSSTLIVRKRRNMEAGAKRKREDSNESGGEGKRQMTTSENELFVGGITSSTSKDTLMEHFSQFGDVVSVVIRMRPKSSKNKCYAFITFTEASSLKKAMAVADQEIDSSRIFLGPRKKTVVRPSSPPSRDSRPNELFVGGLNPSTERLTLKEYFSKYGKVIYVDMPMDKGFVKNKKGYGFVSFESAASLQSALGEDHEVDGVKIDVMAAESKSEENGAASKKVNTALASAKKKCEDDTLGCEEEGENGDDADIEKDDEDDK